MTTFTYASRVVARSTVENDMTQGTEDVIAVDDGEPKPTTSDDYFLFERGRDSRLNCDGKWMLFYLNRNIDAAWVKAKALFRKGLLTGIAGMKVSGARHNPRAQDNDSHVLIFYCGPVEDEENVLSYGANLLRLMRYQPNSSNPYVYYKSDQQTFAGTKATGQKKNHLYRLRVPSSYENAETASSHENGFHAGDSNVPLNTRNDRFQSSDKNGACSSSSSPAFSSNDPAHDASQRKKRKMERMDEEEEVEETRKRISRLSPSRSNPSSMRSFASAPSASNGLREGPTVRVKIRFENIPVEAGVDTVVASFRADQRLDEVVRFLSTQIPTGLSKKWALLKTFPTEELADMNLTVEEAGLANAVVIARRTC